MFSLPEQPDYKGKQQRGYIITSAMRTDLFRAKLAENEDMTFNLVARNYIYRLCKFISGCLLYVRGEKINMMALLQSRNLSISVNRDVNDVYNFVCIPENFPRWASGLGKSLKRMNGDWIAETPHGPVKVRFTERNEFGIVDHWVIPEPGLKIHIPMRVISNGDGSELIFTLFRLPGMTDERFAADAEWVMRDLASLKKLLEAS